MIPVHILLIYGFFAPPYDVAFSPMAFTVQQVHETSGSALLGIHLQNFLSCNMGSTCALPESDIEHKALSCYTYNTQVRFGVLNGVASSSSNGDSQFACIDPRFENPSARSEL